MFKKILIGLLVVLIAGVAYVAYMFSQTRQHSPKETVEYTKGEFSASLVYCRPYKKGRLIFGLATEDALVPYGEKWRTGANEATEITVNQDIKFDSQSDIRLDSLSVLKAGTYSLYTIPNEQDWTIAFNSMTAYWGVGFDGKSPADEQKDVLRVITKKSKLEKEVEQFTISFSEDSLSSYLVLEWDDTQVRVPFQVISK